MVLDTKMKDKVFRAFENGHLIESYSPRAATYSISLLFPKIMCQIGDNIHVWLLPSMMAST